MKIESIDDLNRVQSKAYLFLLILIFMLPYLILITPIVRLVIIIKKRFYIDDNPFSRGIDWIKHLNRS